MNEKPPPVGRQGLEALKAIGHRSAASNPNSPRAATGVPHVIRWQVDSDLLVTVLGMSREVAQ
jgi:hypothetical protein